MAPADESVHGETGSSPAASPFETIGGAAVLHDAVGRFYAPRAR
jgi:hypothetical protein